MKIPSKFTLAALLLTSTFAAHAQWASSYSYSSTRFVAPYYRPPSDLCYRAYAAPQPLYTSSTSYTYGTYTPSGYGSGYSAPVSVYGSSTQIGGTTFHNYYSSEGGGVYGSTTTIGNTSYTWLYGW